MPCSFAQFTFTALLAHPCTSVRVLSSQIYAGRMTNVIAVGYVFFLTVRILQIVSVSYC